MENKLVIRNGSNVSGSLEVTGSITSTGDINGTIIDTTGSLSQTINSTALALAIAL